MSVEKLSVEELSVEKLSGVEMTEVSFDFGNVYKYAFLNHKILNTNYLYLNNAFF